VVSVVGDLRHIACRSTVYAVVLSAEVSLDASRCNHNTNTKTKTNTKTNQLLPYPREEPTSIPRTALLYYYDLTLYYLGTTPTPRVQAHVHTPFASISHYYYYL
jgi:hypothetical protein